MLAWANWATREFFRIRQDEVLSEFRAGDPRYGLISEFELAVIAVCIATWADFSHRQFFAMGSGNMNAISWTTNGKARQGKATRLLYCLLWYCIKRNLDFFSFVIRSGRNITPDCLSRASHTEMASRHQRYEMERESLFRVGGQI